MVGNDVEENMIAASIGMHVFLMTECLIHKHPKNIMDYPNGGFAELMEFIRSVCVC